jgi:hypothetical protein
MCNKEWLENHSSVHSRAKNLSSITRKSCIFGLTNESGLNNEPVNRSSLNDEVLALGAGKGLIRGLHQASEKLLG